VSNAWIPTPVSAAWCVVFAGILLVHLWHAVVMSLRHRLWHTGHCVMAAGMIAMFWPAPAMPVPARVGVAVFAAAALALGIGLLIARGRGVRLGWLWLLSVVDLGWMGYMFAMMSSSWAWLSILGAVWFGAQAAAWASGRLGRVVAGHGLGEADPATHHAATQPGGVAGAPAGSQQPTRDQRVLAGPGHAPASGVAAVAAKRVAGFATPGWVIDGGPGDYSVRISLTLMALGMAYMLLAMQFGVISIPGMPGMPPMPGM